jgi:hypothetical protein
MAMANMKQSGESYEAKAETMESDKPEYPYGLCLHLGKDELTKLGMTELPDVGMQVMISAKAFVKSTSAYDTQDEGKSMNVSLQITDMEVMPGEKQAPESIMYPGS